MVVSIRQVATEAGVSNAMVSMALNNHPKVSQARKKQIRQIADRLGYRPSMVAQNLRGSKTSLIGIMLPSAYYGFVLGEIEAGLRQQGYNAIACVTNFDLSLEMQYIDMLMRRRVEGIIVLPTVRREHEEYSHLLLPLKSKMPVLFVDHVAPDSRLPRVTTDDFKDTQIVMRHLIGLGYKRIAFAHIGFHKWDPCITQMFEGYKASLEEANIPYDESLLLQTGEFSMEDSETYHVGLVKDFLTGPSKPEAILAYTDMLSFKLMHTIRELGMRIPQDIAIAGLNDSIPSAFADPPLTTIQRGSKKMASRSAEIMVEMLKNADPFSMPVYECYSGELVVRESCGAHKSSSFGETE